MSVTKWTFSDPVTLETYEFDINPKEGAQPGFEKQMAYETTAAAEGGTLVYEGRKAVQKLGWNGFHLDETEYLVFVEWFEKGYQIDVTDDLNNEFRIYITSYRPERKRSIHYPNRRDYSIEAIVVNT